VIVMARRKTADMSDKDSKPAPGENTRFRKQDKQTVILDYRGTVGRATEEKGALRNEPATPHRLSPLFVYWPENGQDDLQLQPGINLVPAKLWRFYTEEATSASGAPGHPQVMELIQHKAIREIDELPDDQWALLDLIKRSMDRTGLEWIAEQESQGEERQEVLDAVADRLAKVRSVKLKRMVFQKAVPLVKDPNAEQPSMAMG
jgi:hypothetical protein